MENTVAKKLESLLKLQIIDSKLDEIRKVRGDLPAEVQDLEDEIAGYETRIGKYKEELTILNETISKHKQEIKEAERLIEKYQQQQTNVKNNREFEAISKEMELQDLETQVAKKKIRETLAKIEKKEESIEETENALNERNKDLKNKRKELDIIMSESEEDEDKLKKEREKRSKLIEPRLYKPYMKTRENAQNGLAVVTVKRDACGGCFNIVPPQRQAEIREKKKIIVCEHCGRIFADVEEVVIVEKEKPKKTGLRKKGAETAKVGEE
jgi:predicted  nucleic acid-binding Zn-ribbon protein